MKRALALLASFVIEVTFLHADVTLTAPKLETKSGDMVEIPLVVRGAKGMSALQLRLSYSPEVLEVVGDAIDPDLGITRGEILPGNAIAKVFTDTPGKLPILFLAGADPEKKAMLAIERDGTLLSIRFRVIGSPGRRTPLVLEMAQAFGANDMDIRAHVEPGEVVVAGLPLLPFAAGIGALILLLFLIRRGKSSATAPIAPASAPLPSFSPQGATFAHECPQCRGVIQLPEAMRGSAFQCGACGASQIGGAKDPLRS